jgi:predicted kinase
MNLIILVGNIGSGKTTTVKKYAEQGYCVVCRDDFRTMLGGGSYKFDTRTEKAIHQASRTLLENLMVENLDIIIDETNTTKRGRKTIINTAKLFGYNVIGIVMPQLTKEKSIENRIKDNLRQNTIETWGKVWDMFNRMYETPELKEGFDELIWETEK